MRIATVTVLTAAVAGAVLAQGGALERVASVRDGRVEFHFASHRESCGDGLHWMRTGEDSWSGVYANTSGPMMSAQCERGPVRVLLTKADGEIVRVEAFVGPLHHAAGATDLGAVPARDASEWLLTLAGRADGRPARDAILPAVLADSVAPTGRLAAVANDHDRARATRRSAIVALGRLADGAGLVTLSRLAREASDDEWLGREATRVLATSDDPRARDFLREGVTNTRWSDAQRAAAIAGLGNDMATGDDARLLREAYRTLEAAHLKDAVLTAVGAFGGRTSVDWLLAIARDRGETPAQRRHAVAQAERAGASGVVLARLFDEVEDTDTRGAVIGALAQNGSKPARDKLIAVAKSTELGSLRRRAIAALSRFDGPELRSALAEIGNGRP